MYSHLVELHVDVLSIHINSKRSGRGVGIGSPDGIGYMNHELTRLHFTCKMFQFTLQSMFATPESIAK